MKSIGLVIPCYNEELTINKFYHATNKIFNMMKKKKIKFNYKYMFVNDGSIDNTLSVLRSLYKKDPKHVNYISFSRNFGEEPAMLAGFKNIHSDYTAKMDADLQDPPSLMPKMFYYLQHGYDCVGCFQKGRKQGHIRAFLSRSFYSFLNHISSIHIQPNVRDFCLMNNRFLRSYLKLHERNRFTKGLFAWEGYKTKFLPFKARSRSAGKSDWTIGNLVNYSIEAIIDFSDFPIKIIMCIGTLMLFTSIIEIIIASIFHLFIYEWIPISSIILFISSINLFCILVIGKYVTNTYIEVKHRPLYLINERNLQKN